MFGQSPLVIMEGGAVLLVDERLKGGLTADVQDRLLWKKGAVGSGQLPQRVHCLDVGKMVTVLHSPAQPIQISSSKQTKKLGK
jgi:hypothetical protein